MASLVDVIPPSPSTSVDDSEIDEQESSRRRARAGRQRQQAASQVATSLNSSLSNGQRLTLGILVLLLVDVIWVASSELSEYIFHDENYNKPFFSTYLKTSMFLIFLLGFLFWTPWQDRCLGVGIYNPHSYSHLSSEPSDGHSEHEDGVDDNGNEPALSHPIYVPINYEPGSGNESSDDSANQRSVRFNKVAEVRHLSESDAADAIFSRLSYEASEQMRLRMSRRLGIKQTAQLAITFCLLWFLANYTYQLAISNTEAGIVNILSSSSSLFTLILAAIFPSVTADKFTLSRFLAVLLSVSGVVVVSLSDLTTEKSTLPLGAIFALVSAFFYASYLVFLRKKVDHEDKLDIPMFFGFVGLFNLIMLWPIFILLNYSAYEPFEFPSKRQFLFLVINGIIGTVFSEVLWLWGCFLTSSLIATLAISLTIPMSLVADVLLKRISYSSLLYIGAVPMVISFFAVTFLSHYEGWDPALDLLEKIKKAFRCKKFDRRYQRVLVNDIEQRESLIGINYDEEDELEVSEDEDEESDDNTGGGDSPSLLLPTPNNNEHV